MNTSGTLAIIGGAGISQIEQLADRQWLRIDTPYGDPSDEILTGTLHGQRVAFLARHGRAHTLNPSEINYRANIDALKRIGVTDILAFSTVGSLREEIRPGMFVIVDQFIDFTHKRATTFFENGIAAHVSMAQPVCPRLGDWIQQAACATHIPTVRGGTYLVMEGPQFSSLAESRLYRQWNCDVIGMTNMPEAKLAREAEICYATVGMVTDYDCWHPQYDHVTVEQMMGVVHANIDRGRGLVQHLATLIQEDRHATNCACRTALQHALMTPREACNRDTIDRLANVAARML